MFKKLVLATLCSAAVMSAAHAAESVVLKVTGTLTSGSCTPVLNNAGVVDFGHIPISSLSKTAVNRIGQRAITLTVTCDSEMPVGWQMKDNKSDTLVDQTTTNAWYTGADCNYGSNKFGLGKSAAGTKLGAYCVGVNAPQVTVDGAGGDLISSDDGTWVKSVDGSTRNGAPYSRSLTMADTGTIIPKAGKVFVYPLLVTASVQDANTLAITDDTPIDGSATISLVYL